MAAIRRASPRLTALAAAALGSLTLAASAPGQEATGSDCSYASGPTAVAVGSVVVYAETTPNGSGMANSADVAVGTCLNLNGSLSNGIIRFDGGSAEAGAGDGGGPEDGRGAYAIADGDNENTDPTGGSDGYFGLSTYEEGASRAACPPGGSPAPDPDGSDPNSGGCFGFEFIPVRLPLPVACGNTDGNSWNRTSRDGCIDPFFPDF
jgi:hypothetical protein